MMRFAAVKKVITPRFSFVQQGFAARHNAWTGVHDEIYATAAVLEANKTLALISLDLISGDREFETDVYAALENRFSIPSDYVILSYTHTHGVLGLGNYGGDEEKKSYRDFVLNTVVELVGEAASRLREAEMSCCRTDCDFGISRRLPSENGILWGPNDNKEDADHDLTVLKIADDRGLISILYNYACHPTACGPSNLEITADWPGAVRSALERKSGETVMFLQGCGADIKPVISASGKSFVSLSADEMTEKSRCMADAISNVLRNGEWKRIEVDFTARSREIFLPCVQWDRTDWEKIAFGPSEPEYRKKAALRAIEKYDRGELSESFPFRVKCVRLSKDTRIICLENEMVNGYGKMIKKTLKGDTVTLGYTGRICCYIPTARILREGGYECDSFLSASTAGPFDKPLEELIVSTAAQLASECENAGQE